jgi:hypothetical protein
MMKKLLFVLIMVCLALSLVHGRAEQGDAKESIALARSLIISQSNVPADATNWGPTVHGIRLTIVATDTSFPAGSRGSLVAIMTNSSTDSVDVTRLGIDSAFYVFATNAIGKLYRLTPNIFGSRDYHPLNPTNEQVMALAIIFATNMEPGEYTVRCSGRFSIHTNIYSLESNPLKLQVK